jgi:hypothetical protein
MKIFNLIAILVLIYSSNLWAQSFSATDFMPPAAAETEAEAESLLEIQAPADVSTEQGPITEKPAVKAATPQDAINAYIQQRNSSGFTEFRFPSGFGFIATGSGIYKKFDNPTTTRINQRNAYNKAYTEAKKNLTEGLYGLSTNGKNVLAESMSTIDASTGGTLTNASSLSQEELQQSVEGFIRGFVVYDVHDDFEKSTVFITIVSTPKTQGKLERPDRSSIVADSVIDGLNAVVVEAKKGLVPPVGGRAIFVPSTGELAYVGFGSAVVRFDDSDPAIQARLTLNAERIARMRASDSLCSIIIGDDITANSQFDTQTSDIIKDFNEATADDPLNNPDANSPGYQALTERKKEFINTESNSSTITSIRGGKLPPGVNTQGWLDKYNTFAYAMSVYLPSASDRAAAARDKMQQGAILQDHESSSSGNKAPSNNAQSPGNRTAQTAPPVTAGPSGTVQSYDDL